MTLIGAKSVHPLQCDIICHRIGRVYSDNGAGRTVSEGLVCRRFNAVPVSGHDGVFAGDNRVAVMTVPFNARVNVP